MLIAVHSFTPVFDGFARPWEIGLLYEHDDRLVQPLKEALLAVRPGLTVGDNEPYAIVGPSDYSIPVHGQGRGLPHIEFEVRQDLIGTVAKVPRNGPGRWLKSSTAYTRRSLRSPSGTGCRPAPAARCNACPVLSARKPTSGEDHPFSVARYSGCGTILR